ncbi:MAG TPA: flavodoxin family protein [Nitrospirae bacterium]|nr:hypothetical protein BMS3Abin08_00939 [bacterium BMS3Abin08]HDY72469.1 flavodoxin family protein [Nitrospirota bacterium]
MKISVILGHPKRGSFNHAIAGTVVKTLRDLGHEVIYHDLYEEGFRPVLLYEEIAKGAESDPLIKQHCDELSSAEGIVVIHPNWWGQPPAILKGWIDRVFRAGVAYEFVEGDTGEGVPAGLLKAKAAVVFNTSNTPPERELKVFGDPLERIWKNCIFDLCGVKNFYRKVFSVVVTSTPGERGKWLDEVGKVIDHIFPS